MADLSGEAEVLLQGRLETPAGTSTVCRYASAYVRDLNREDYRGGNDALRKVSAILDAASKHLAPPTPEASKEVKEAFAKSDAISFLPNNCPILERTGDGRRAGRCCFHLKDGVCERHGDVSKYRDHYQETGKLTDENEMAKPAPEQEEKKDG